jgi:hypothetical protein
LLFYDKGTGNYMTVQSSKLALLNPFGALPAAKSGDPGWSWLMPFDSLGKQYYLAYEAKGARAVYRLDSAGDVRTLVQAWNGADWPAWSHVAIFTSGGRPHVLWYRRRTGEVAIERIDVIGAAPTLVWGTALDSSATWLRDWTLLSTLRLNSVPHVLLYNGATGSVKIQSLDPIGTGASAWISTTRDSWQTGIGGLLPFEVGSHTYVLRDSLVAHRFLLDRLRTTGGSDAVASFPLLPGRISWAVTEAAAGATAPTTRLLAAYNPLSGVKLFSMEA